MYRADRLHLNVRYRIRLHYHLHYAMLVSSISRREELTFSKWIGRRGFCPAPKIPSPGFTSTNDLAVAPLCPFLIPPGAHHRLDLLRNEATRRLACRVIKTGSWLNRPPPPMQDCARQKIRHDFLQKFVAIR